MLGDEAQSEHLAERMLEAARKRLALFRQFLRARVVAEEQVDDRQVGERDDSGIRAVVEPKARVRRRVVQVDGLLEVIEIAPGIDLEKDVLARMGFRPRVSPQLKRMDRRLFCPEPMNLAADFNAKQHTSGDLRAVV